MGIASSHYIPAGIPGYPDSAIVTCAYDHSAIVQHPESSEIYHNLRGHTKAVVSATHTPLGDIVTGSADKYVISRSQPLLLTQPYDRH